VVAEEKQCPAKLSVKATAIAHIVFTSLPIANRQYQDAISLRRVGSNWKIILPDGAGVGGISRIFAIITHATLPSPSPPRFAAKN
jgi:hypothetical protein